MQPHTSGPLRASDIAVLLAIAALGLLISGCVIPEPPPLAEQLAAQPIPPAGSLLAGVGKMNLTPDPTRQWSRLVGYGGPRDARTIHRKLYARAVVFAVADTQVAIVSIEQLIIPEAFARAVQQRVARYGVDDVWVHATHTHSAEGGYWNMPIAEITMLGPYNEGIERRRVDAAVGAIEMAVKRRVPVVLEYDAARTSVHKAPGHFAGGRAPVVPGDPLNVNRRRGDAGKIDDRVGRLIVRRVADGFVIGQVFFFSAHATVLSRDDHAISGDWPGELSRAAERDLDGSVALVCTCAVGDAAPRPPSGPTLADPERTEPNDQRATRMATSLLARLPRVKRPPLEIELPDSTPLAPVVVRSAMPLLNLPWIPDWVFFVEYPVAALADTLWMPDVAEIRVLRLGDLLLVGWPSEPAMAHQLLLREAAHKAGFVDVWLISNVNGWFGYTLDQESYDAGDGYEDEFTLYGTDRGDHWLDLTKAAMKRLAAR